MKDMFDAANSMIRSNEQPAAAEPTEKKGKGRPKTAPPCHKKQIAIPDEPLEQ